MILFLIILTIIFFLSLLLFLLCLSNIEIEIKDLKFDSENKKHYKLENYLFFIRIKLLDKITWFRIRIDKNKMKKIENSKIFKSKIFNKINEYERIRDIILKNRKEILKKGNIKYIKGIEPKIKQLKLDMKLCTSDSIFTSFSVAILASILSLLLAKNVEKFKSNKYRYIITPKYEQKPSIIIKLNCIIGIKIVHIMNVIYMLIKKRRVEYDERTSNRRTYVCSND